MLPAKFSMMSLPAIVLPLPTPAPSPVQYTTSNIISNNVITAQAVQQEHMLNH